jgi:hypothetical protein
MKKIIIYSLLFLSGCALQDPQAPINKPYQFIPDNNNILADGVSKVGMRITMGDNIDATKPVSIQTDFGNIDTTTNFSTSPALQKIVISSTNKQAQFILKAGTLLTDSVRFVIGIGSSRYRESIAVKPSLPEDMSVTFNKYAVSKTDTVGVNIKLYRKIGKVSDNLKITLEAISKSDTSANLIILPFVVSKDETAKVIVKSKNMVAGDVKIRVSIEGVQGVITKEDKITINK